MEGCIREGKHGLPGFDVLSLVDRVRNEAAHASLEQPNRTWDGRFARHDAYQPDAVVRHQFVADMARRKIHEFRPQGTSP